MSELYGIARAATSGNNNEMSTWKYEPVEAIISARITRSRPALPRPLDQFVEEVWNSERQLRPRLFNGDVFSVDAIRRQGGICHIEGHWTEYRRIVAQLRHPEVAPEIGARPLAVAGVLQCADGVVLGRRPQGAAYQANLWQLAPAGNVDPACAQSDVVEVATALRMELREELGLSAESVRFVRPVCLVRHPDIEVLDLAISLASKWTEEEIRRVHRDHGDGEYPELAFVKPRDLEAFLARERDAIAPQVPVFLRAAGLLP